MILGVLGAIGGVIACSVAGGVPHRAWKLALVFGLAVDFVAAGALYVADFISPGL